jgi:hypothetical protein
MTRLPKTSQAFYNAYTAKEQRLCCDFVASHAEARKLKKQFKEDLLHCLVKKAKTPKDATSIFDEIESAAECVYVFCIGAKECREGDFIARKIAERTDASYQAVLRKTENARMIGWFDFSLLND